MLSSLRARPLWLHCRQITRAYASGAPSTSTQGSAKVNGQEAQTLWTIPPGEAKEYSRMLLELDSAPTVSSSDLNRAILRLRRVSGKYVASPRKEQRLEDLKTGFARAVANSTEKKITLPDAVKDDLGWCETRLRSVFRRDFNLDAAPEKDDPETVVVHATQARGAAAVVGEQGWVWRWHEGWETNQPNIKGWMLAVELGLRTAVFRGLSQQHIVLECSNIAVLNVLTQATEGVELDADYRAPVERIFRLLEQENIRLTVLWDKENVARSLTRGTNNPDQRVLMKTVPKYPQLPPELQVIVQNGTGA
ncbi:hypothetical protein CYLTODRAFT_494053 [Cylindrobasidium torrendii FP15055 ss-10]|uniref:Uncharacterized protein n=1 Tax=Cylindrobasidium torrendii FP15055 ss-10 TaxID=1314674 RepID=A0A0D7B162_9AGAR|nr:hypothetical protein CYLTODRAFT_494053 [Cylindrobasidium torrendii FP15055 ss-10]